MPKPCDSCHSSSAVLYCRADAAYLCAGCDTKVHCANKLAQRHERVWVCDVCEVAPAVVTCKADAAALCVSCDTDIHSANPLARRHERAPVTPFFEFPGESMKVAHINAFMIPHAPHHHHHHHHHQSADREVDLDADDRSVAEEAASWLLPHPKPLSDHMIDVDEKSSLGQGSLDTEQEDGDGLDSPSFLGTVGVGGFSPVSPLPENCLPKVGGGVNGGKPFKVEMSNNGGDPFSDLDPYLDLDYASAIGADPSSQPCDSLVPVRHSDSRATQSTSPSMSTGSGSFDGGAVCKNGGYSYPSQSLSSSSLDVGIVPDSSMSDSSNSYMDSISPGSFEFPAKGLQMGQVEPPMAREARVLRYREKRKNRKFEKTIRYASRKAYAESRPRIKGRFAKRTPSEISGMPEAYSAVQETGFGVVPAF